MTSGPHPCAPHALALAAVSALALLTGGAGVACAQVQPKPVQAVPAPPPALSYGSPAAAQAAATPAFAVGADKAAPTRSPAKVRPSAAEVRKRHKTVRRTAVQEVLHTAEVKATEVPRPTQMINAALHYEYEPGKIYTIHTAPAYLTAVELRAGERLISKAAGDTVRWEVGETSQGAGQVVILIKPLDAGLRTNMILTTDQRVYVLDLVSGADGDDHSTLVDWRYPAEEMRELTLTHAAATVRALAAQGSGAAGLASPLISPPGVPAPVPGAPPRLPGPPGVVESVSSRVGSDEPGVSPASLNFAYKVEAKGHLPRWMPEHVFDDGHKVFVKFPTNVATMEIPPLFVVGPKGEAELVNYRFENGYYVVDRLFQVAELRLGSKDQTVVQLVYKGGAR